MKTLLLMRHAKSSWKDTDLADHERPLNKRGKKDSVFMGAVLKEKELLPQIILASSAVRIRETITGLTQESAYAGEIEFSDELYLAEPEVFLRVLCNLPDTFERVMLMGHNPGLEGLLQVLSGRIESLPTGSVAYLSLPVQQWSELSNETEGELIEMLLPHELRELEEEKHKGKDKKEKKADKKEEEKEDKKESKKEDKKEDKKADKKEDEKESKKENKKEDKKAELIEDKKVDEKESKKENKKEDKKAELTEDKKEDEKEIKKESKKVDKKAEKKEASKEKKAVKKK